MTPVESEVDLRNGFFGEGYSQTFELLVLGSLYEGFLSDSVYGYLRSEMIRFRLVLGDGRG